MKTKKVLIGFLALALVGGTITSCKKSKTNKRVVGDWSASAYSESTSGSSIDAVYWDHDADGSTDDQKGTETSTWTETVSLASSEEKNTEVSTNGETVITTTSGVFTRSIDITLNEDGTMTYSVSDQLNSQSVTTSPTNVCDTSGWGVAGLTCDGTYTYVSDNTSSYTISGLWYWGNNTDDRASIVFEIDGGVQVWTVTELDKEIMKLTRTESLDTTDPSWDGAGTDTEAVSTTYTMDLSH
ncbi:MAG: hypothetical protein JKY53_01540 [Flavobacteriales bacterium]|nr:hypothetical protein [Flavobacteriales bacterium]